MTDNDFDLVQRLKGHSEIMERDNRCAMNAAKIAGTRDCAHCYHGHHFTPRADEVARYGESVMGCRRSGYEGYTRWNSVCEAFAILQAKEPTDER